MYHTPGACCTPPTDPPCREDDHHPTRASHFHDSEETPLPPFCELCEVCQPWVWYCVCGPDGGQEIAEERIRRKALTMHGFVADAVEYSSNVIWKSINLYYLSKHKNSNL